MSSKPIGLAAVPGLWLEVVKGAVDPSAVAEYAAHLRRPGTSAINSTAAPSPRLALTAHE
jgi:hypothetical protein